MSAALDPLTPLAFLPPALGRQITASHYVFISSLVVSGTGKASLYNDYLTDLGSLDRYLGDDEQRYHRYQTHSPGLKLSIAGLFYIEVHTLHVLGG